MPIVGEGAPWPYDITIDGRGHMMERTAGEDGASVPRFLIRGQRQIQERLDTGDIVGVFGSPESAVPWNVQDFSGGMGLREQVPGVSNRYYYASDVDTRVPLKTMGGPALTTHTLTGSAGTVRAMAVMNVNGTWTLFVGSGRYVFSSPNGTSFSESRDLGSGRTVTSMQVYQGSQSEPFLFVGVSAGQNYWTYSNGAGWTEDSGDEAEYFATVKDELWRAYLDSNVWKVAKATNGGAAATWASGIQVGDPATGITEMLHYDDRIYVFKEDQVLTLQHGATSVTEEVWPGGLEMRDDFNGTGSAPFGSSLYMVLPDAGLYQYTLTGTDQVVKPIGPGLLAMNDSAVRGPVTSVCGERDYWLYATVQNEAGNSFLLATDIASGAWHGSIVDLGAITCRKMIVTDKLTTNPRLFIGMNDDVGSIILPRAGRDRSQDSNCTYSSTGSLYFPRFTGNMPFIDKSFVRAASRADGLDDSNTIRYYYRSNPTASFSALGSAWTAVPQTPIDFPSAGVKSQLLDVRIDFATGITSTPSLSSVTTLYNLRPEFQRRFEFTVVVGDRLKTNEGTEDTQTYEALEDELVNLFDSGPIEMTGPNGRSYTVMFDVEPVARPLKYGRGEDWKVAYDCVAFELAQINTKGTWFRLEAYTWGQLESYTWGQMEGL